MGHPQSGSDKMGRSRLFRIFLILGSLFMILLIIIYWDDVGATHFYLHTTVSGPHFSHVPSESHSTSRHKADDDKGNSFLSDIDAFINQFLEGTNEPSQQTREDGAPEASHNQSGEAGKQEERYVPRREWKIHLTPISVKMRQRQESRKQLIHDVCTNGTLDFLGKNRTFDDIPNRDLDHLIVDDRHGIIYCYVPKVACTNWKRIMIVLSESLLVDGVPYQDPLDIPQEHIHNSSVHFTFNKFWKRYGKFSRHLMKIKLKKYTKFLFVRDPFVRLISAYRNKFEQENEEFYKRFAVVMLRKYSNYSDPPASVVDAFAAGIRPSFSNFVQYLLDPQTEKEMSFNEHWRQVYRLCHPCQINYDFVGKLETLEEDAEHLLRILRVDNIVQFPASYRNRTVSSWEQDWFANIPFELRRKLYKLYEADFQLLDTPSLKSCYMSNSTSKCFFYFSFELKFMSFILCFSTKYAFVLWCPKTSMRKEYWSLMDTESLKPRLASRDLYKGIENCFVNCEFIIRVQYLNIRQEVWTAL